MSKIRELRLGESLLVDAPIRRLHGGLNFTPKTQVEQREEKRRELDLNQDLANLQKKTVEKVQDAYLSFNELNKTSFVGADPKVRELSKRITNDLHELLTMLWDKLAPGSHASL